MSDRNLLSPVIRMFATYVLLAAPASHATMTSVPFVLNEGAQPAAVRFHAKTFGGTVFVTEQGSIRYALPRADRSGGCVLDEQFAGSRVSTVEAGVPSVARLSVFLGKDPAKWRSSAPCFETVSLGEVYEGIRVDLHAYGKNVEKLFTVAPGALADRIEVRVDGGSLCLDEGTGELVVETAAGEVRFTRPVAFQEQDGVRTAVDVAYRVDGNTYGFALGNYDASRPVVIDPLLASTFLGGSDYESVGGIAVDGSGNVYVGGSTESTDFPFTTGSYAPTNNAGNDNAFVSILDPSLSNLVASIVFGGDSSDNIQDLTIGENGRLYVAGSTDSTNFPVTAGAYDESLTQYEDAFVAEISTDLTNILAATYIGGDDGDFASCLAVDENGAVYVAGSTASTNFPVGLDDYQQTLATGFEDRDGFLCRLDPDLTKLLDSTYYGGEGNDVVNAIAIGNENHAYIGGYTQSPDLPKNLLGYDKIINSISGDGFIAVFTTNLNDLISATFLGGDGIDSVNALTAGAGLVYAAGGTRSDNFPTTPGAYDTTSNGQLDQGDMFVTKLDYVLHNVMASTLLGGTMADAATAITVDTNGNIVVAGYSSSSNFPTAVDDSSWGGGQILVTKNAGRPGPSEATDAIVASLTPNLAFLTYARYLSSEGSDFAADIARGPNGEIYVAGFTDDPNGVAKSSQGRPPPTGLDFPTTEGAYDTVRDGYSDAFITRLSLAAPDGRVDYDFDNDDRADMTVLFLDTADWYVRQSGSTSLYQAAWGWEDVIPVPADYDGDTIADIAVYFPGSGIWYILRSSDGQPETRQWGWYAGYPVPADYDGDGKADLAVYEKASATWYIWQSSNDQLRQRQWGWDMTKPVPGDYTGDGIDDIAVYDPVQAVWYILNSSDDTLQTMQWGYGAVDPIPADYDGDGLTDIAVFDRGNAVWFIYESATGTLGGGQWGWNGVEPVPADYDGDGKADIAVYHQESGGWYIQQSSDEQLRLEYWGWFDAEPIILQDQINNRLGSF